jgi:hypothetical protein
VSLVVTTRCDALRGVAFCYSKPKPSCVSCYFSNCRSLRHMLKTCPQTGVLTTLVLMVSGCLLNRWEGLRCVWGLGVPPPPHARGPCSPRPCSYTPHHRPQERVYGVLGGVARVWGANACIGAYRGCEGVGWVWGCTTTLPHPKPQSI